jgi:diguanylate cyclase (GGDEF)-like protein
MSGTASSPESTPIRVAIADQGIDGAAAELRQVLAGAPHAELLAASAIDTSRSEPTADARAPDVVVLTWGGGTDLGAAITAVRRVAPDSALVVVIPWYDEAVFLSAVRLGAEDCITAAQIDIPGLMRTLLLAVERHRMTTSLRAAAFTDELTGLYNRRGYVTRAVALLKTADPKVVWQIFFDVDDLKRINDDFGHWAGDRALIEVANVLRLAFRSTDIVARVGGDEFAVLAVAPADAAPESWTARWREPLNALSVRRDFPLSVSVGVAQPDEHAATTPDDLLTRADSTMYTAKRLRKKLADVASREPPSGEFALSALVRGERRAGERKERP